MELTLLQSLLTYFVMPAFDILLLVMFIYVIFSWLVTFGIVNLRNPIMGQIYGFASRVTEFVVGPVRKFIPPLAGFDMAFFAVILGLYWVRGFVLPKLFYALG